MTVQVAGILFVILILTHAVLVGRGLTVGVPQTVTLREDILIAVKMDAVPLSRG